MCFRHPTAAEPNDYLNENNVGVSTTQIKRKRREKRNKPDSEECIDPIEDLAARELQLAGGTVINKTLTRISTTIIRIKTRRKRYPIINHDATQTNGRD